MTIVEATEPVLLSFFRTVIQYVPNFVGGILILSIGVLLSSVVRSLVRTLFRFFKVSALLQQTKIGNEQDIHIWVNILTQIIGWAVIILFLIPASEVWGLPKVTDVLRQLLFYIPSVLAAVIIAFVGIMFSNMASDLVRHGVNRVDKQSASTLAALAKYSIVFFTVLIVLDQLRVAQDLIRILFTGIVIMISLAGGLAFGLGGKDLAKDLLEKMRQRV
jgi:hypothetical protein